MTRKRSGTGQDPDHGALVDLRALVVLLLSVGAGWLAYEEGGWAAGVSVGVAVSMALHVLLRR